MESMDEAEEEELDEEVEECERERWRDWVEKSFLGGRV